MSLPRWNGDDFVGLETSALRMPVSATMEKVALTEIHLNSFHATTSWPLRLPSGVSNMLRIISLVSGFLRDGARQSAPCWATYLRSMPAITRTAIVKGAMM